MRRRDTEGCCVKLLQELRAETPELYKKNLRMTGEDFDLLVSLCFMKFEREI